MVSVPNYHQNFKDKLSREDYDFRDVFFPGPRGIARLIRTGSNPAKRETPALPTFPETATSFSFGPHP